MLFGPFRMIVVLARALAPLRSDIASLRADARFLKEQVQAMSTALDNLKAAVTAQTTIDQSAVTLIQGIAAQLKNVSDDADVQTLADELSAAAAPLASAVSANMPVSAPVAPVPTPASPAASVSAASGSGTATS